MNDAWTRHLWMWEMYRRLERKTQMPASETLEVNQSRAGLEERMGEDTEAGRRAAEWSASIKVGSLSFQ